MNKEEFKIKEEKDKKELIEQSPENIASFNKMIKSIRYPMVLYSILLHHTKKDKVTISDLVIPFLDGKEHKGIKKGVITMLKNVILKLENQEKDKIIVDDTANSDATSCKEIPINLIIKNYE